MDKKEKYNKMKDYFISKVGTDLGFTTYLNRLYSYPDTFINKIIPQYKKNNSLIKKDKEHLTHRIIVLNALLIYEKDNKQIEKWKYIKTEFEKLINPA